MGSFCKWNGEGREGCREGDGAEGTRRWVRFAFRSATEDTEEHRGGRWVRFVIPRMEGGEPRVDKSVRTALTARSARKWFCLRGLGSGRSKKRIKKRSRVGPAVVRVGEDGNVRT